MNISAMEAFELIEKARNSASPIVILDVRKKSEFESGHLPGAVLLPISLTSFARELNKLDKDATYMVYCRSGVRSQKAVAEMEKLGFKKIYMLSDGIISWENENLPIEK